MTIRYSPARMLDARKVKAISLDLDETLWPIAPVMQHAERVLLGWLDRHAPMTAALFSNPHAMAEVRAHLMLNRPGLRHDLITLRRESIRLALYRSAEDPLLAGPAFEVFFEARNQVTLFVDVMPALEWLRQRYAMVALTNGNADVKRIGIGGFFDAAISARDFGIGKPDPRIFHAAAGAVSCDPQQVLHVGDDATADVLGCMNVGMQSVWVNRHAVPWQHLTPPDLSVNDLGELCRALQAASP